VCDFPNPISAVTKNVHRGQWRAAAKNMLNLTPVESRIVRAIVAGASNRRAALELNLSESAVNKVL
jgi:DNA-binding NarL/FixJ family response regulator